MEHSLALGKFPIYSTIISKNKFSNTQELIGYFKSQIENHPQVSYIATFDHYNHTKSIGGDIPTEIKDIQNIIFCFGMQVPTIDIVAIRPRSIGVTEFEDRFVINFMEAPGAMPNKVMAEWVAQIED